MSASMYHAFLTYGFPAVELLLVVSLLVCCRRRRSKVKFAPNKRPKKSAIAQKKSHATQTAARSHLQKKSHATRATARSQLQKKTKSSVAQLVSSVTPKEKSLLRNDVTDNEQKSSIKGVQKKKTKGSYVDMLLPALEDSGKDVDVSGVKSVADRERKCGIMEES